MRSLGTALITLGVSLAVAGALVMLADRLALGRLAGDITFRGRQTVWHIPLTTCLLTSLALTLLLNLWWHWGP